MTDTPYISVDGFAAQSLELHVPAVGPWFASLELVEDLAPNIALSTITVAGTFTAVGTVITPHDGSFAGEHRTRIVAGAGQWGAELEPRPYRDDAGIGALLVAQDAARECGETLATFAGTFAQLGVKYVRNAGPASRTLEDAARGAAWWVDFAGQTQVGTRTPPATKAGSIQLLDFDAQLRIATLNVDDLTQIGIGTVITDERLDAPITVGAYTVKVTPQSLRVIAYCEVTKQTPIVDALRAIIGRATDAQLFGKYRYRVVNLEADRVNVQSVSAVDGLPNLLSVAMVPGVAGVHAKLALGAIVYVEFIAGDRSDPEITGFSRRGDAGFVPTGITIGASDDTAPLAARQGDGVEMLMPPMIFTGTMLLVGVPTPFTAVGQATTGKLEGVISGASAHNVRIG